MTHPPVVYVPCERVADDQPPVLKVLRLHDGRSALLGYTALDRLALACGAGQPWALLRSEDVTRLRRELGVDLALLDVPLPPHLRTPA